MLRFYCFLTGDQYAVVSQDTPKSRQKVVLIANALLIPVLEWGVNGFLLAYQILQGSLTTGILVCLICSLLIFLVERVIIMSVSSLAIKKFRLVLGTAVAIIGAVALDEVIFKNDIDTEVKKIEHSQAQMAAEVEGQMFDSLRQMRTRREMLIETRQEVKVAEANVIVEMDGKGSGWKGAGKITREKAKIAANKQSDLMRQQKTFDSLLSVKAHLMEKAKNDAAAQHKSGLLIRLSALVHLVFNNFTLMFLFIVFSILMFCLEFIVVLVKMIMPETNYEKRMRWIEEIGERRMNILSGQHGELTDPGYILPGAVRARKKMEKRQSIF